jgi:hypothetical protein
VCERERERERERELRDKTQQISAQYASGNEYIEVK